MAHLLAMRLTIEQLAGDSAEAVGVLGRVRDIAAQRGLPILAVGGCVRDALLDQPQDDFDFVTSADPIPLARAVADSIGGDFFVMDEERRTARVLVGAHALTLDFTQARGATWDDDMRARDFTINAIGMDLSTGALLDPLDGRADLAARVVRLASVHALNDDPLRALRAVRIAEKLGARIAPETAEAVRAAGALLSGVSAERVRDELMRMLDHPSAERAMRQLLGLGLLARVAPEAANQAAMERLAKLDAAVARLCDQAAGRHAADTRRHFAQVLSEGRARVATLRLSALLLAGRPREAEHRARALRLSARERHALATTAKLWPRAEALVGGDWSPVARHRLMDEAGEQAPSLAALLLALHGHDAQVGARAEDLIAAYFEQYSPEAQPARLLSGEDVLALGVPPGARVGEILAAVREAQMIGEVTTREGALRLAETLVGG